MNFIKIIGNQWAIISREPADSRQ